MSQHSPGGDSPYGLADMAGNVREWCSTIWEEAYLFKVQDEWVEEILKRIYVRRVLRGGPWKYDPQYCRCAYRLGTAPGDRYDLNGFRVVVSPSR